MEKIFNHIQLQELLMISLAYGIGQYWFLFQREIDAISNTNFIFIRVIAKSYNFMIILGYILSITFYGFVIYSWYLTNWNVALAIFVMGLLWSVGFNLIYKSDSIIKSYIETFFIFLFYFQIPLIGFVIWNFVIRNT
jgi:hypothetical protein